MTAKRDGVGRTIIVSNRLPVQATASNGGGLELKPSIGGLVRGLEGVHGAGRSLWVGALGMPAKDLHLSESDTQWLDQEGFLVVDVPSDLYELYYEGFSNDAIWPLFHYTPERCHFSAKAWEAYRKVNAAFAEAIDRHVQPGDRVWIHDYQLMLVPDMLRRKRRDLSIGFFLHIPFPSAEVFRILPWRREILTGLLGADLIGFHTLEYMRHFSNAVARIMGIEPQLDTVNYGRRHVRLGAFPLGINTREIHDEARSPAAEQYLGQLHKLYQGRKVILGVDRLDYTKGIPDRLAAFRAFLERRPEWVGNVSLVQVSVPSRVNVAEYQELKREVDEMVGMINGFLGSPGYIPIHYIFRNLDKAHLFALYRFAHVALITPLRDGLNLVCKEYVAAKGTEPGALVLSEFAGSAAEMGDAILVNPWSQDSMIAGIENALMMKPEEGAKMMSSISDRLARYDNRAWSRRFLGALHEISEVNHGGTFATVGEPDEEELSARVANARRTFFFIDYDGTLVAIAEKPELAVPTDATMTLLRDMATIPTFHVHVISGRDRRFMTAHLPHEVVIIAEHGACIRRVGEEECVSVVDASTYEDLRNTVRGIMADFEQRIPGSLIEEKEFGIVWHYRMADPIFAHQQALVLADTLGGLLQHTPLGVQIAKKAVEVRYQGVNKGEAVRTLLEEQGFDPNLDLLVTMGDDRTDEDMFRVYPGQNVSISVSDVPMAASYVMEREAAIELLETLTRNAKGWQYRLWERA